MKDRLQERGIDMGQIKKTIMYPDFAGVANGGKLKARKKLENGVILEVIYAKDSYRGSNYYFIVTAYYLKNYV